MITHYPNYDPHTESCPCAHHEGIRGSRGVTPFILDLNPRRRWVVSFTPQPLYLQQNSPHCGPNRD